MSVEVVPVEDALKVVRVDTGGILANMVYVVVLRNGAVRQDVAETVYRPTTVPVTDASVAVDREGAGPSPTASFRNNVVFAFDKRGFTATMA